MGRSKQAKLRALCKQLRQTAMVTRVEVLNIGAKEPVLSRPTRWYTCLRAFTPAEYSTCTTDGRFPLTAFVYLAATIHWLNAVNLNPVPY
ncbi:hypothetical protein J6590_023615 [Homalodisca vitripennis]|nr:hypothetical protein J6590_023615 [Homalodisca vitripennis]